MGYDQCTYLATVQLFLSTDRRAPPPVVDPLVPEGRVVEEAARGSWRPQSLSLGGAGCSATTADGCGSVAVPVPWSRPEEGAVVTTLTERIPDFFLLDLLVGSASLRKCRACRWAGARVLYSVSEYTLGTIVPDLIRAATATGSKFGRAHDARQVCAACSTIVMVVAVVGSLARAGAFRVEELTDATEAL